MYSLVNFVINMVSKVVFKYSYEGGKLSSKVMKTLLFLTSSSKQMSWSASDFTRLMWSNKSSPSLILDVEILWQIKRMLDKLFIPWMLQKASQVFLEFLQLHMFAKLNTMMDIVFFTHLWYYFFTCDQHWKLKFSPLILSMFLTQSPSSNAMLHSKTRDQGCLSQRNDGVVSWRTPPSRHNRVHVRSTYGEASRVGKILTFLQRWRPMW